VFGVHEESKLLDERGEPAGSKKRGEALADRLQPNSVYVISRSMKAAALQSNSSVLSSHDQIFSSHWIDDNVESGAQVSQPLAVSHLAEDLECLAWGL